MPPDRARCANPQGRQKSCSECAKAKRRCDLEQPNCLRCTRQKLKCTYPPQPRNGIAGKSSTQAGDTFTVAEAVGVGVDLQNIDVLPFDLTPPVNLPAAETDLRDFDFDFSAACNSLEDLNDMLNGSDPANAMALIPSSSINDKTLLPPIVPTPLVQSRVMYSVEQLALTPRMFVEENATFWSHPKLYEDYMPRCLQDAYAACALYLAKNDTNGVFVVRHIAERAQELIEAPRRSTPIEMLAWVHALLLYQIMLVYSRNIRYYSQAENLIPHLEEAQTELIILLAKETDPVEPLPFYPSSAARNAWTGFIFRESCRRTLLATCQSVLMCKLFRGALGICAHDLSAGSRLTVSRALWNAKTPLDFAIAWNEKNHFLVKDMNFTEVLQKGTADDVDVFGRMMMVGIMGIDDMRGWFHTRGGQL